jgi:hypothetical protein
MKEDKEMAKLKKINDILQDVVNGCTANNVREDMMVFNINYYLDPTDTNIRGIKCNRSVRIAELENTVYGIIAKNLNIDTDVVIADITIVYDSRVIKVNKEKYCYSLSTFMKSLV